MLDVLRASARHMDRTDRFAEGGPVVLARGVVRSLVESFNSSPGGDRACGGTGLGMMTHRVGNGSPGMGGVTEDGPILD